MAMARRADSHDPEVPGLAELVDRGIVVPATRRLSDVLAEHPPVTLGDEQAVVGALDEQRVERA
jgi:hypothetical protein